MYQARHETRAARCVLVAMPAIAQKSRVASTQHHTADDDARSMCNQLAATRTRNHPATVLSCTSECVEGERRRHPCAIRVPTARIRAATCLTSGSCGPAAQRLVPGTHQKMVPSQRKPRSERRELRERFGRRAIPVLSQAGDTSPEGAETTWELDRTIRELLIAGSSAPHPPDRLRSRVKRVRSHRDTANPLVLGSTKSPGAILNIRRIAFAGWPNGWSTWMCGIIPADPPREAHNCACS